jgi:hypothetical protein
MNRTISFDVPSHYGDDIAQLAIDIAGAWGIMAMVDTPAPGTQCSACIITSGQLNSHQLLYSIARAHDALDTLLLNAIETMPPDRRQAFKQEYDRIREQTRNVPTIAGLVQYTTDELNQGQISVRALDGVAPAPRLQARGRRALGNDPRARRRRRASDPARPVRVRGPNRLRIEGEGPAVLLVQTTTRDHMAHRTTKLLTNPIARAASLLAPAVAVEVHGWARRVTGNELPRWEVDVRSITPGDFIGQPGELERVRLTPARKRKDIAGKDPRQRSLF